MKNYLLQIGQDIVGVILLMVVMILLLIVGTGRLLYLAFEWLAKFDGFSNNKEPAKPLDPKLEKEFDDVFSKKPFPEPYSPTTNPLYLRNHLPPFDREKIFKAVDESSVRMEKMTKEERRGLRHNLRDERGRFIKRTLTQSPITRYGEPTWKRFGNH